MKCQTHKFSLVSINNQKDAKKQHLTQFFSGNINLLSPTDINGKYVFQFYTSNSNEKTDLCVIDSKDTEMNNISPARFQFLPDS